MGYAEEANHVKSRMLAEWQEQTLGDPKPFKSFPDGCPKCAGPHDAFIRRFCPGRSELARERQPCQRLGEHLHLVCGTCGFPWLEHPASGPVPDLSA